MSGRKGEGSWGIFAIIVGIGLLVAGARVGSDPELGAAQRAVAAASLLPAGVSLLAVSHRALRAGDGGSAAPRRDDQKEG